MSKKIFYLLLGGALITMGGCSKKLGQLNSEYFNTVATPLETVGETVTGNVYGNIPMDDLMQIRDIFMKGITLWHGDWIGDYSRSNEEV